MTWLLLPACAQAICMLVDEAWFHRRRGLPRWERLGHPLDTLSLLAPLCLALSGPAGPAGERWFAALAVFSCLCITKDEFVHADRCDAAEHWLHALLFVLHPLVLACAWLLWRQGEWPALALQTVTIAGFLCYQTFYWNFFEGDDR
jgi:hypothetical protein